MATCDHVTFVAKLTSLHPALEWVRSCLAGSELSNTEIGRIELAVEEVLVNIISYAYMKEEEGNITLECHFQLGQSVKITVKDWGCPFNPLEYTPIVNLSSTLEDRKEGGMGIVFIKRLMDRVEYTRSDGANILTLIKDP